MSRRCSSSVLRGRCVGIHNNRVQQEFQLYSLPEMLAVYTVEILLFYISYSLVIIQQWPICLFFPLLHYSYIMQSNHNMTCKGALQFAVWAYPLFATTKPLLLCSHCSWYSCISSFLFLIAQIWLMNWTSEKEIRGKWNPDATQTQSKLANQFLFSMLALLHS